MTTTFWDSVLTAEEDARKSKWGKWLRHPILYPVLLFQQYLIYRFTGHVWPMTVKTFFGLPMKTLLPSGMDIALHGIKAHDSEIRLSKYICRHLNPGDTFFDVGAHFGYYSLLASFITGQDGIVFSIEPSSKTADVLRENVNTHRNIHVIEAAASERAGELSFWEYSGPESEWNTTVPIFENSGQSGSKPLERKVAAIKLDDLIRERHIDRAMIKIDAEGGELSVLKGLRQSMNDLDLILIMEYHLTEDAQSIHNKAARLLHEHQYYTHAIDPDGMLIRLQDIHTYLSEKGLDSDNLVFIKHKL